MSDGKLTPLSASVALSCVRCGQSCGHRVELLTGTPDVKREYEAMRSHLIALGRPDLASAPMAGEGMRTPQRQTAPVSEGRAP